VEQVRIDSTQLAMILGGVRRTGIPKLACPKSPDCKVVEATRPVGLVEGNRYDTSVAAEIMVAQYAYR